MRHRARGARRRGLPCSSPRSWSSSRLLFLAPLGYAAYLSLFQHKLIGGTVFVGLDNYVTAVTDPLFLRGVRRVAVFFVLQVPVMLLLALVFALALDSGLVRLAKVVRLGIFVPYAVPSVVAALMWGYLYGPDYGPFAQLGRLLGLPAPRFLGDDWMLGSLANIVTWEFVGYNMIILYAALRTIPQELYEAAAVDGAGAWRIAWSIKLPALRPALLLTLLFSVIGSFQLFNEPKLLQPLAPTVIDSALHRQPLRLLARLHRSAGQLRGHGVVPAGTGHRDRLLRRPAHREPQEPMTVMTPAAAPDRGAAHR